MPEIKVKQQSEEWHKLRKSIPLTASVFGEAIGVGKGKPGDFLRSLLDDDFATTGVSNVFTTHGHLMEPVINEAYQLLTNRRTRQSGFWTPAHGDKLHGLVGASPDALVMDSCHEIVGLAEYKAPFYKMYCRSPLLPHGIPRHYMVQMQGQMAVTKLKWCDFMAVCTDTKEVKMARVYFHPQYWENVSHQLQIFCTVIQEAQRRKAVGMDPFDFPRAQVVLNWPILKIHLPHEKNIRVDNRLLLNDKGHLKVDCKIWMPYEFLIGKTVILTSKLMKYGEELLKSVDEYLGKEKSDIDAES